MSMYPRFKKDIVHEGVALTLHWDFEGRDAVVMRVTLDDESTDVLFEMDKALDFITGADIEDAIQYLSEG